MSSGSLPKRLLSSTVKGKCRYFQNMFRDLDSLSLQIPKLVLTDVIGEYRSPHRKWNVFGYFFFTLQRQFHCKYSLPHSSGVFLAVEANNGAFQNEGFHTSFIFLCSFTDSRPKKTNSLCHSKTNQWRMRRKRQHHHRQQWHQTMNEEDLCNNFCFSICTFLIRLL